MKLYEVMITISSKEAAGKLPDDKLEDVNTQIVDIVDETLDVLRDRIKTAVKKDVGDISIDAVWS